MPTNAKALIALDDQNYAVIQLDEHLPDVKLPQLTFLQSAALDWLIGYNRGDEEFCNGDIVSEIHLALEDEGIPVDLILVALKAAGKDKVTPEPPRSAEIMRPGVAETKLPNGGTAYTKL